MSFIVGSVIIGAGAVIGGAMISSKGSKDAAKTAAGGSASDIAFQRESRDLARSDQAPWREAGGVAVDALMSMTGLKRPGGATQQQSGRGPGGPGGIRATDYLRGLGGGGRGRRENNYETEPGFYGLNYGGNLYGRAHGGALYNINELGPESVYENGSYTRSSLPKTVPPSNGYVAPNIQGRTHGGDLPVGVSDPNPTVIPGGTPQSGNPRGPGWRHNPPATSGGTTIDNNTGQPQENPGGVEGGYNFMTDPGYGFRIGEGQRALERGAAAAGGLLSGGYGRRLTRYAQDYASNEYTNVYNRISNIAGLGQVSAGQSGNAALYAGRGMGTAAAEGAYASAYGQQGSSNAWANAANQIGQLPWGDIFNRNPQAPGVPA